MIPLAVRLAGRARSRGAGGGAERRWWRGTRACARVFPERLGVAAAGDPCGRRGAGAAAGGGGERGGACRRRCRRRRGAVRSCARAAAAGASVRARASSEHVLLLVLHHIAGRRLVAVAAGARPVARLCGALRGDGAASLPALPVQYADYTLWQHAAAGDRERSATARWRASLAFWTETLARAARAARAAERPAAACGGEPSRRQRARWR